MIPPDGMAPTESPSGVLYGYKTCKYKGTRSYYRRLIVRAIIFFCNHISGILQIEPL